MGPFDIRNETEWTELLEPIARASGLTLSLIDASGATLVTMGERGGLCERIRADEQTLTFVCSQTSRAVRAEVTASKKPVTDVCEAGLFYGLAPIVREGEIVGFVSGCGLAPRHEPPDPFFLSKQLSMDEAEAQTLAAAAPAWTEEEMEQTIAQIYAVVSR